MSFTLEENEVNNLVSYALGYFCAFNALNPQKNTNDRRRCKLRQYFMPCLNEGNIADPLLLTFVSSIHTSWLVVSVLAQDFQRT